MILKSSNVLDELESYYLISNYNSLTNPTYLSGLNDTVSLNCFVDIKNVSTNLTFKYCYRSLNFILFGFNVSTASPLSYAQAGNIILPTILSSEVSYNATVTMFQNYTFQPYNPTTITTASS